MMAISDDKVRLQAVVDRKVARKIELFADRMGLSQSKMMALLLESAVENDEWAIRLVTSNFARRVEAAFGKGRGGRKSKLAPEG